MCGGCSGRGKFPGTGLGEASSAELRHPPKALIGARQRG